MRSEREKQGSNLVRLLRVNHLCSVRTSSTTTLLTNRARHRRMTKDGLLRSTQTFVSGHRNFFQNGTNYTWLQWEKWMLDRLTVNQSLENNYAETMILTHTQLRFTSLPQTQLTMIFTVDIMVSARWCQWKTILSVVIGGARQIAEELKRKASILNTRKGQQWSKKCTKNFEENRDRKSVV